MYIIIEQIIIRFISYFVFLNMYLNNIIASNFRWHIKFHKIQELVIVYLINETNISSLNDITNIIFSSITCYSYNKINSGLEKKNG